MIGLYLGLIRAPVTSVVCWDACCQLRARAYMPQQMVENAVVHIVDDDESLRRAVDSLCRSVGFETRTYATAQAFLDAKRKDMPGCLVLDVRLPGMSGL